MPAWDDSGACFLKICLQTCKCTSLHVLCSFGFFSVFPHFGLPSFEADYTSFVFFFHDFFFVLFYFEGINWCFVSYSFVSVKGPGRKLSLPTDLKTDLGTVGESQQFSLDFLWVSAFLMVSRLLCCISTFGFHSNFPLSVSLLLCPPVQPAHETVGLTCSSILPVSVFWFKASVFVPSTFCKCLQRWFVAHAHIWTWGILSLYHDWTILWFMQPFLHWQALLCGAGSLATSLIVTGPCLS